MKTQHTVETKLSELQQMIAGVIAAYPAGKARGNALKACQWRLRGPNGEFVGLSSIVDGLRAKFVPEAEAMVFDGRDNEDIKLRAYERTLGALTVEILPQIK